MASPRAVVLLTLDFAVLSRVSAQVAMTPEWLTAMVRSGMSSSSETNVFTSLVGIQDEPRRALISPGRRSTGWTAFKASTLRR